MVTATATAKGKLAQTLESLQLSDGRPDLDARRTELDSLVRTLTIQEIRRLRIQLNAVTIPNDISTFPVELLLCIAQHLDLQEVTRLLSVSHAWNKVFSSPDFCVGVLKTHFRSVWEQRHRCLSADQQLVEKMALPQWLPRAMRDRIRRQRGQYQSLSVYRESRLAVLDWQYKNGRIAFKRGYGAITVRDLRTDQTTTYMDENRVRFTDWHISDEYLFVAKSGPTSLIAWPLEDIQPKNPESIRLPGPVMRITAKQNRVGIVTATYSVLVWTIGGALISVETSVLANVKDFLLRQRMVVFHPIEQNLFFVIHEAWSKTGRDIGTHTRRIIVQEFDEGKLKITKRLDLLSSSVEPVPITGYLHDGVVGIFKIVVPQPIAEQAANKTQTHNSFGENTTDDSKPRVCVMATFDIYAMRFVLEDYCLPDLLRGHADKVLERALYWRNQVLFPVNDGNPLELKHVYPGVTEVSVVAINPHKATALPHKVPSYGPKGNEVHFVDFQKSSDVAYYWIGDADFGKNEGTEDVHDRSNHMRSSSCAIIQGDDDFVVLLGRDGWDVWRFHKSVNLTRNALPLAASELDTANPSVGRLK